jgi:hypothetical protein
MPTRSTPSSRRTSRGRQVNPPERSVPSFTSRPRPRKRPRKQPTIAERIAANEYPRGNYFFPPRWYWTKIRARYNYFFELSDEETSKQDGASEAETKGPDAVRRTKASVRARVVPPNDSLIRCTQQHDRREVAKEKDARKILERELKILKSKEWWRLLSPLDPRRVDFPLFLALKLTMI